MGGGGGGEADRYQQRSEIPYIPIVTLIIIPPVATINSLPCFRMKRDIMVYHNNNNIIIVCKCMSLHEVDVLIRP